MKEYYSKREAVCGSTQEIEFEDDKVSLNIPLDGVVKGGWKIVPLIHPTVCLGFH